jgi:hypothetical protein
MMFISKNGTNQYYLDQRKWARLWELIRDTSKTLDGGTRKQT